MKKLRPGEGRMIEAGQMIVQAEAFDPSEHPRDDSGKFGAGGGGGAAAPKPKRVKPTVKIGGQDHEIGTKADPDDPKARRVVVGGHHVATVTIGRSPVMVPGASYSSGWTHYKSIKYHKDGLNALGLPPEKVAQLTASRASATTNWGVINNISRDLER